MTPTALGLLRTAYVIVGALLAATVAPRLGIPAEWAPDLVLIGVVATAVLRGPVHGALVGLAAGWVVELVPPAGAPLGLTALVLALAGALAGALGATSLRLGVRAAVALVVAALTVVLARSVAVAAVQGSWELSEGLVRAASTAVVALVALPVLLVVDDALVRRRLG